MDVAFDASSAANGAASLSSKAAMERLMNGVREMLARHGSSGEFVPWASKQTVRSIFSVKLGNHFECGPENGVAVLSGVLLLICGGVQYAMTPPYRATAVLVEGLIVISLALVIMLLCVRETYEKNVEIVKRIDRVVEQHMDLLHETSSNSWPFEAVDPASPASPSISLVQTVRDGVLVDLPTNMLVEGDVVLCAVGQAAPGRMRCVEDGFEELVVERGVVVEPLEDEVDAPAELHRRQKYVMEETPLMDDVRVMLNARHSVREPLIGAQLRVVAKLVYVILAVIVLLSLVINVIRYAALSEHSGSFVEMIFILQIYAAIPLLPLVFPAVLHNVNAIGVARLLALYDLLLETPPYNDAKSAARKWADSTDEDYNSAVVNSPGSLQSIRRSLPDTETYFRVPIRDVIGYFLSVWRARAFTTLPRSASLLWGLGTTTVLCAVDKEGVLAHPMPSVEKVFLTSESAHDSYQPMRRDSMTATEVNEADVGNPASDESTTSMENMDEVQSMDSAGHGHIADEEDELSHISAEDRTRAAMVLDVSFDPRSSNGLRFIDVDWVEMLPALKPLGLNVLLNTCCHQPWMALRLADHVRYLSLLRYNEIISARKKCLCMLGKAIGFTDSALNNFVGRQQIWTFAPDDNARRDSGGVNASKTSSGNKYYGATEREPVSHMISQIIQDNRSGGLQLLSEGTPPFIVQHCTDLWDGHDVRPLDDDERKAIIDFYSQMSRRMLCVAFSYRPIITAYEWFDRSKPIVISLPLTEQNDSTSLQRIGYDMQQGQVFIGMVAVQRQPREAMVKLIEEMSDAGIRFVYFSHKDANSSKAFAEKMGLETGWNCHISLAADSPEISTEGISQLPRGIQNIRPHLQAVDDVPLLVPLFTDCTQESTQEMVQIMQEHGEIVACLGSSLRNSAVSVLSTANISIGVEPLWPKHCLNVAGNLHFISGTPRLATFSGTSTKPNKFESKPGNTVRFIQGTESPILALAAEFSNTPCSLAIGRNTNLYIILHLIREARRLLYNARNCTAFMLGCCLALSTVMLLSYVALLPPILNGLQLLWTSVIIVPLLGLSLLSAHTEETLMTIMPDKNKEHLKDIRRYIGYYALRFVPSMVVAVIVFGTALHGMCSSAASSTECNYFGHVDTTGRAWSDWTDPWNQGLALAQNIALFFIVLYFAITSATFLNRTKPIWRCRPHHQQIWALAMLAVIVIEIVYFAIYMAASQGSVSFGFNDVPWYTYVIGFGWVLAIIPVNEAAKSIDAKRYVRLQKRSRLLFGTKLGMHSPV